MTFRVGMKVVCVGLDEELSSGMPDPASARFPDFGPVYTIRTINVWARVTLITLFEIDNSHLIPIMGCAIEPGFDIRGFRPVVEHNTDISIFTEMLTPKVKEVVT